VSTELFARKASGLARSVSAWDATIYNIMWMAPLGMWIYSAWACSLFPGVDLPSTVLICEVVAVFVGSFYALFSAAMPRSGGDYIWMSRSLHPAIGFSSNFFFLWFECSVGGALMWWVTQWSLAPMFDVLGNAALGGWLASTNGTFIVGVVLFIVFGILITRGAKATHYFLWIAFILSMISWVVYNGTLLSLGREGWIANFNALSGMNYNQVVVAGTAAGYPSSYVLTATLLGSVFTYFSFTGFNCSVYYSAEIKNVRKSQFLAILGSSLAFMTILWVETYVTSTVMGQPFYGALSYLWGNGNPAYGLPFPPFFQFLYKYAVPNNPLLYALVAIGFAAQGAAGPLTYMFAGTRMIFAWAFDRVVPMSLAKVDSKYSSPYMAIILMTVISIFCMGLWAYTPLLSFFLYGSFGWMVMQFFASIAGIIFPWKRKDIFDTSPEIVRKKVAGVPLISLLGVATLIGSLYIGYASVAPAYMGTFQPGYLVFTIAIFIAGGIIYGIASLYRRRSGLPLELTFKEIPPE
jgi:amino acid transporter